MTDERVSGSGGLPSLRSRKRMSGAELRSALWLGFVPAVIGMVLLDVVGGFDASWAYFVSALTFGTLTVSVIVGARSAVSAWIAVVAALLATLRISFIAATSGADATVVYVLMLVPLASAMLVAVGAIACARAPRRLHPVVAPLGVLASAGLAFVTTFLTAHAGMACLVALAGAFLLRIARVRADRRRYDRRPQAPHFETETRPASGSGEAPPPSSETPPSTASPSETPPPAVPPSDTPT